MSYLSRPRHHWSILGCMGCWCDEMLFGETVPREPAYSFQFVVGCAELGDSGASANVKAGGRGGHDRGEADGQAQRKHFPKSFREHQLNWRPSVYRSCSSSELDHALDTNQGRGIGPTSGYYTSLLEPTRTPRNNDYPESWLNASSMMLLVISRCSHGLQMVTIQLTRRQHHPFHKITGHL